MYQMHNLYCKICRNEDNKVMLKQLLNLLPAKTVYAHCDIPCGIYDPNRLQQAAHTVIRMTQLLQGAGDDTHKLVRLTQVKEEHAEIAKHEVVVLWGDYFKPEHLEKFPELSELVLKTLKTASKIKQEINKEAAEELLSLTQQIAEIFYKTKGLEPVRVKSPYPTEGELVIYK